MLIKVLLENRSHSKELEVEHGLSLYIESKGKKILFDTGASDLFFKNASKLGVDIGEVEELVISHGHSDHGGGLKTFIENNNKAHIYLNKNAFNNYYAIREGNELEYIGLDKDIQKNERIVLVDSNLELFDGVHIFSGVPQKEDLPKSNKGLMEEYKDEIIRDRFVHEQNLVLREEGKNVLVTGCSHNGILNILSHYYSLYNSFPDVVLGGFHLSSKGKCMESDEYLFNISKDLLDSNATFYTGHCTGEEAFARLKELMGNKIEYMHTGKVISI